MNKEILIVVAILALVYFMTKKKGTTSTGTPSPIPNGAQTTKAKKSILTPEQKAKLAEIVKKGRPKLTAKRLNDIKNKVRTPEEKAELAALEAEIANAQTV